MKKLFLLAVLSIGMLLFSGCGGSGGQKNTMDLNDSGHEKEFSEDYTGAIQDYDRAIKLDSLDARIYFNRGGVKGMLEDYQGAIQDFNKAIELENADICSSYYMRGITKYRLEDYEGAIQDFDKVIELDSKSADAYANRGEAKILIKEINDGCVDFQKALDLGLTSSDMPKFDSMNKNFCK